VYAQRQGSHNQLLRANTNTELNRQQFSQTQNSVASAILQHGLRTRNWFVVAMAVLVLAAYLLGFLFYMGGWKTWYEYYGLPCDQPLANWLLFWLLFVSLTDLQQAFLDCTQPYNDERCFTAAQRFKFAVTIARGGPCCFGF